ncbi:MAG: dTDP-glucose 4,6-dehydratase [Verrucomicrobiales bacterium]
MKIIVTGGCGFIGANLVCHTLETTEYQVFNFDKLTYAGNATSLKGIQSNSRYHFKKLDICDRGALDAAIAEVQPDALIHLAAESHVDRSIDAPGVFIQTNVVGTFNLLQASLKYFHTLAEEKKSQFRFIHVSTDEVYGSLDDEGVFTEQTPYAPRSPYAASKAASDHLARAWHHTYGLPVIVTNCTNNYGPFQFPEKLIPLAILKAIRGEPIPIYGSGEQVRDWLHVRDHASALLTVLEKGKEGETYNIGGANERRNIDLVRSICGILDEVLPLPASRKYHEQIIWTCDRPGHDFRYAMDIAKIRRDLGWTPAHPFDQGLRETVCWYLENEEWWQDILSGEYRLQRLGAGQKF